MTKNNIEFLNFLFVFNAFGKYYFFPEQITDKRFNEKYYFCKKFPCRQDKTKPKGRIKIIDGKKILY